jgi:hypothetical protein
MWAYSAGPVEYIALDHWWRRKDVARLYDGGAAFLLPADYAEIREGTCLQHLDLAEYMRARREGIGPVHPIRHIVDFVRYPAVEKLWKAGFKRIVLQHEIGIAESRLVRWKQEDVKKALPIPWEWIKGRERARLNLSWVAGCIKLWKEVEAGTIRAGDARLLQDLAAHEGFDWWMSLARKVPIAGASRYLQRQATPRHPLGAQLHDYLDYLKQCEKLKLDYKRDKSVRYPKDLQAAHMRLTEQIKAEEDARTAAEFAEAAERLRPLAWVRRDMLIRPAESPAELREEGKALHHCVGGYAKRMADGRTAIFFVRKEAEPDEPFYTLEYSGGKIVQCRTLNNASYEADEKVRAFCEEWLAWTKKKGTKTWTKETSSQLAAR